MLRKKINKNRFDLEYAAVPAGQDAEKRRRGSGNGKYDRPMRVGDRKGPAEQDGISVTNWLERTVPPHPLFCSL